MSEIHDHISNAVPLDAITRASRSFYLADWNGSQSYFAKGARVFVKVFAEPSSWFERIKNRSDYLRQNCKHQNLIRIIEVTSTKSGLPMIVSEFVEGENLRVWLEDFRSPTNAVSLFKKIVAAVSCLHSYSIVHRDLKPENIMVAETEKFRITRDVKDLLVKVGDFDTARPTSDSRYSSSEIGTPRYMAPEQRKGESPGLPADIYALGLMLYETLAGRKEPKEDELRPSRFNRAVRGNLDQIVLSCLQSDPTRRCTIEELSKSLDSFSSDCVSGKYFPTPANIPAKRYPKFPVGELELDVVNLIGGDALHRYNYPDGIIVEAVANEIHEVPDQLLDATEDWLRWREADANRRGAPFENRRQPRLLNFGAGLTEGHDERLYPLRLKVGVTDYFNTQCTNFATNLLLPDGRTIGEAYGGEHNDFENSALANPLATNFSVVTCGDKEKFIFTTQRGKLVGGNPEFGENNRVPAISGTGHPFYDRDPSTGVFCPFRSGLREAKEEVLGNYPLSLEEITFFGLARTGLMMFPFLFGEIRLRNMTAADFQAERIIHRNDVFAKEGRPFTIESVTAWIRELYLQRNTSGRIISRPSHTGIFSLYQSLIYEFPDEISRINRILTNTVL